MWAEDPFLPFHSSQAVEILCSVNFGAGVMAEEKTGSSLTNLRKSSYFNVNCELSGLFFFSGVMVHPLVIMSIADHQTREKVRLSQSRRFNSGSTARSLH